MIGILAGMGPKSTGPFIDQVVSSFQLLTGAKNDIDFPPMMIYSLPTPFYIDEMILSIKSSAPIESSIRLWEDLAKNFLTAGIDTILLACTDLNVMLKAVHPPFHIIDSSACLAEAVVQKWEELKRSSL